MLVLLEQHTRAQRERSQLGSKNGAGMEQLRAVAPQEAVKEQVEVLGVAMTSGKQRKATAKEPSRRQDAAYVNVTSRTGLLPIVGRTSTKPSVPSLWQRRHMGCWPESLLLRRRTSGTNKSGDLVESPSRAWCITKDCCWTWVWTRQTMRMQTRKEETDLVLMLHFWPEDKGFVRFLTLKRHLDEAIPLRSAFIALHNHSPAIHNNDVVMYCCGDALLWWCIVVVCCGDVLLWPCIVAVMYCCGDVLLWWCIVVVMYCCDVFRLWCIAVVMYCCSDVLLWWCIVVMCCGCDVLLWWCIVAVMYCCGDVLLWWCTVVVMYCCGDVLLWCIVVMYCCGDVLLQWCVVAVMLWCGDDHILEISWHRI